jgi:hypothetical protein
VKEELFLSGNSFGLGIRSEQPRRFSGRTAAVKSFETKFNLILISISHLKIEKMLNSE